jgi:hypothetical protein
MDGQSVSGSAAPPGTRFQQQVSTIGWLRLRAGPRVWLATAGGEGVLPARPDHSSTGNHRRSDSEAMDSGNVPLFTSNDISGCIRKVCRHTLIKNDRFGVSLEIAVFEAGIMAHAPMQGN